MKNFNNNIKSIFELLSFNNNYKVIGSSSSNLFFGDYDLNSLLNYKGKNPETTIYKNFKKIFDFVGKNTELYITDFKLGEDSSGEPLRWTIKEMKKNNNKGYTFEEALLQKSTIKMDITIILDGRFMEITDNYFFTINKYKTFDDLSREERINSLKDKYLEYVNKNAFLKALKRLKSLIKLDEKKHKELELLNNFFDGKNGFLYEIWSEISVILQLITLKNKIDNTILYNAIQRIKEDISYYPVKNLLGDMNKNTTTNQLFKVLGKQNKLINDYINIEVCIFIKKNKL